MGFRIAALAGMFAGTMLAQTDVVTVASPDGQIAMTLMVTRQPPSASPLSRLAYQVTYGGKRLIDTSFMGFEVDDPQPVLGENVGLVASQRSTVDETYTAPAGKTKTIRSHYNSLVAEFMQNGSLGKRLTIEIRAYNDGLAFRYLIPFAPSFKEIRIQDEATEFQFAQDADAYPMIVHDFKTAYEDQYTRMMLSGIHKDWMAALPFLIEQPGVAWVAITEAGIERFSGMHLEHSGGRTMITTIAPREDDRTLAVKEATPLNSPWRVLMIGPDPAKFIESNIVTDVNPPSAIADTSWIKAGKAAGNGWPGAASDTATIARYIDFAAESKLEYVMIAEGWAAGGAPPDITKTSAGFDLSGLLARAKSKGVGVWLSVDWTSVQAQMDAAFPLFEKWGVAGVKIDGMNREDTWMVDFYHRVAKTAAEHHLMIDFHGAFKPDGIERTFPNIVTREAVLGLEYAKVGARANPEHEVMLAFTRMLAGPMDYTPGGFNNVTRPEFEAREKRPMVLGTRAHQLALYVVFESPLTMVADDPEAYKGQREFDFIRAVPTSWDETRVVGGQVGEYVAIARKRGTEWYLGAITNWTARDVEIPLGFLGSGRFVAEVYSDAGDADTNPKHTSIEEKRVDAGTPFKIHLASGGGVAIRFRAVN